MEWKKVRLGDVVSLYAKTITPKKDIMYNLYSLPAFDNGEKEQVLGKSIQSNKFVVPNKCILYNKLNVRFKRVWRIDTTEQNKICSTEFLPLVVNETMVDYQYLYYVLISDDITGYLCGQNTNTSGSHKRIDITDFLNIEVNIPSCKEQMRIGQSLSALDRKIALNRAINHNLEAMAKQLYDYWFVQFDFPDEGGRPYKSSGGEMVWNERLKREIPKGWKVARLDSLARIFTGKKDVSKVTPGKYKFFSCAPAPIPSNDYIYDGEAILVSGNGSYTGRVSYYKGKMDLYQRTYGLEILPRITPFVYYTMKILFEPYHSGGKHGSSIPYIVLEDLGGFEFPFSEATVCHYVEVIRKSFDYSNTIIPTLIESLTTQRDTLLPLLMNGQVSVNSD